MAATANHPDGNFANAVEPDEDIAAIAKQISDHAEVIYQTWKAKGLAPNEILTCHENLNVTNKFDSVLTPKFVPTNDSDSNVSMTDVLYSNTVAPANSGNLEHIIQKFVVEDKARLATRQKNADPPCALSTAKSYPSSIQYALQKFERISPNTLGTSSVSKRSTTTSSKVKPCFTSSAGPKVSEQCTSPKSNLLPSKAQNINFTSEVDGLSTWPIKNKTWGGELSTPCPSMTIENGLNYQSKSSTLPLKKEKNAVFRKNFIDEVAKEEEKLIHALKTGAVIASFGDRDFSSRPRSRNAKLPAFKSSNTNELSSEEETDLPIGENIKLNVSSDVSQNLSGNSDSYGLNFGADSVKRKKRTKIAESYDEDSLSENTIPSTTRSNAVVQNSNKQNANPIRPFLTRGSVAERVMMFEKCPTEILEKRAKTNNSNAGSWKHLASDVHRKIQNYCKEADQRKPVHPPHTTLQRNTKANKNIFIPRFYYPHGKPVTQQQQNIMFKNIEDIFRVSPDLQVTKEQFASVTKACGCPLYWKAPLFAACGGEKLEQIDMNTFLDYWRNLTAVCHDDASKFMRIVTRSSSSSYVVPEDLIPLVQDVVDTHPGLTFLKQAPEFHSRYVHTVICRVYYGVNQSWSGKISLTELRKSDFLHAVQLLEEEEDINQITAYFSYEHFYVIYCKFWELDRDHDLFISKEDLARHSDHALSSRIIDRIFAKTRCKPRNSTSTEGKMSYTDFVIFLLAEEDKRHPRAIEYWFRCMDLDGDGYLSMYELEHFYDEQLQRMEAMGIECLPFEDCLCQMMDMIQPKFPDKISLSDLKRCKMTPIFFDTFFNLEKYLDHEQRDPFASHRDHENDISDWDRYAAEEYELLVAEESGNDPGDDIHYERENLNDSNGTWIMKKKIIRQVPVTQSYVESRIIVNIHNPNNSSLIHLEIGRNEDQFDMTETGDHADDIFSSNLDNILNNPEGFVNCEIDVIPGLASSTVYTNINADVDSPLVFNRSFEANSNSSLANYRNIQGSNSHHSDSSDDYAGDSDDCSL